MAVAKHQPIFAERTKSTDHVYWCHFQQLLRLNNNYCDNLYVEFT